MKEKFNYYLQQFDKMRISIGNIAIFSLLLFVSSYINCNIARNMSQELHDIKKELIILNSKIK